MKLKSWPTWAIMAAIVAAMLVIGGTRSRVAATPSQRVQAISATIRCPTCGGETIAESNVASARVIREEIARLVQQDQTDEEIRVAIRDAYPDATVLRPPTTGAGSLMWVLPVVLIGVGGFAMAQSLRRSRVE